MKNKKLIRGIFMICGAFLVGFCSGHLDSVPGAVLFALGVALIVLSYYLAKSDTIS